MNYLAPLIKLGWLSNYSTKRWKWLYFSLHQFINCKVLHLAVVFVEPFWQKVASLNQARCTSLKVMHICIRIGYIQKCSWIQFQANLLKNQFRQISHKLNIIRLQYLIQSISLSISPSICPSVHLSISPSVSPSVHLSSIIHLSLHQSIHLSISASVSPSVHLSIHQSICLSIHLLWHCLWIRQWVQDFWHSHTCLDRNNPSPVDLHYLIMCTQCVRKMSESRLDLAASNQYIRLQ